MSKPTWKRIKEELERQIRSGELAPGERMPSDAGLALLWNVSRPTAHRALHELMRIGLVDRSRAHGTVVAKAKERKRTGRVALILDEIAQAYDFPQGDLLRGIHDILGTDYNLLWCDSNEDPEREAEFFRQMEHDADGVICYPTSSSRNRDIYARWVAERLPMVLLDRVPEGIDAYAVMSDNRGATQRAVQELIQRGHEHIAFFSFHKPHFSTVRDRFSAYVAAIEGAGRTAETRDVRWFAAELEHGEPSLCFQSVYDALFALTKRDEPVTAIFCVQDQVAKLVISAAEELKITIPDQLEIATFNDWPPLMLGRPWDLHRIVPRSGEIGQVAARTLLKLIAGETPEVRHIEVAAEFFCADADLRWSPFGDSGEGPLSMPSFPGGQPRF